ncbi:MAG: alpha/beta fold hydrolase [bacterium]
MRLSEKFSIRGAWMFCAALAALLAMAPPRARAVERGPAADSLASAGAHGTAHDTAHELPLPKVIERYSPQDGFLRIGPEPERAIPLTEKGFGLILPGGGAPTVGVVVFPDGWRVKIGEGVPPVGSFDREALARGLAILRITTGNPLDFYFDDATTADVVARIGAALAENGVRGAPVYLAGQSLGGTRALRIALHVRRHPEASALRVAGVAVVDAPLDMVRMWESCRRATRDNFHAAAADEGRWVNYLLETNLGGTPRERFDRYVEYSPYVFSADAGGRARELVGLPVRAYHEPDVDWWVENRRKSYYQINSIDLAAFINDLKLLGSVDAELVTTHQARDGFESGSSPHTWSIVDDAELVEWFLAR